MIGCTNLLGFPVFFPSLPVTMAASFDFLHVGNSSRSIAFRTICFSIGTADLSRPIRNVPAGTMTLVARCGAIISSVLVMFDSLATATVSTVSPDRRHSKRTSVRDAFGPWLQSSRDSLLLPWNFLPQGAATNFTPAPGSIALWGE